MKIIFLIGSLCFFGWSSTTVLGQVKTTDTVKLKSVAVSKTIKKSKNWSIFKDQYVAKINTISNTIEALQQKTKGVENTYNAQLSNKIMMLDQRNQYLLNQLNNYENTKSNWIAFKKEFVKEFSSLESDLKQLMTSGTY